RSPAKPAPRSGSECSSPFKSNDETRHSASIDPLVHNHPDAVAEHDLQPALTGSRARWRPARRRFTGNDRLRKTHSLSVRAKASFPHQPPPGEQLAHRQSVPSRRRRHQPRSTGALSYDPPFLLRRPPAPRASLDHLKPRHLRHSRMFSHTTMSSRLHPSTQGGRRRRLTVYATLGVFLLIASRDPTLTKASSGSPS